VIEPGDIFGLLVMVAAYGVFVVMVFAPKSAERAEPEEPTEIDVAEAARPGNEKEGA
jgi:hypothetical protein